LKASLDFHRFTRWKREVMEFDGLAFRLHHSTSPQMALGAKGPSTEGASPLTSSLATCLRPAPRDREPVGPGTPPPPVLGAVARVDRAGQAPVRLAKAVRLLNRPKCSAKERATCAGRERLVLDGPLPLTSGPR